MEPLPEGVISQSDTKVLVQALTTPKEASSEKSTQQTAKAPAGRRSVMNGMKHGPGSKPVWADFGTPKFPTVSKVLRKTFAQAVAGPLG